jgi:hypothetical protein
LFTVYRMRRPVVGRKLHADRRILKLCYYGEYERI